MAGTFVITAVHEGHFNKSMRVNVGVECDFVADESADVPDLNIYDVRSGNLASTDNSSAYIKDVSVLFDATNPPTSVTITLKDRFGVPLLIGDQSLVSQTLTASGYMDLGSKLLSFVPGFFTISVSVVGANSAAKITPILV
jgi:hypothetical protein